MKLDLPLHLRLPLDDAWAVFNDAGALARAIPGAAVAESDAASARGTLKVELGWASVAYRGAIRVEESDVIARSVTLRGIGQGEAGEGLGEMSAVVTLREEGGGTAVHVNLDVTAEGDVEELLSEEPAVLTERLSAKFAAAIAGQPAPPSESEPAPAQTPDIVAPDIPEPQRLSPMEEVALADAASRAERGEDEPPSATTEPAPEPAEEPPIRRLQVAEPQVEVAEPQLQVAEPQVEAEPEESVEQDTDAGGPADATPVPSPSTTPLVPEAPKAPRTGSIPPPGWTPPAPQTGGGGAKSRRRGKPAAAQPAEPSGPGPGSGAGAGAKAGAGGLAGLLAKARGVLKR